MRVLHVMTRMAPGGTEHQLVGMLERAHGRFWDATLCVLTPGWPLADRARLAGVPVIELAGRSVADVRRALELRRIAQRFDVIHSSLSGANIFARLATMGRADPALVVSERGVETSRGRARVGVDHLLRGRTDAFIGNSPAVTDFICGAHGIAGDDPRLFEIGNGIDTSVFRPTAGPAPGSRIRLVTVGRLVPGKRVETAISVLGALIQMRDAELVIVGEGPERERLELLASGKPVTFAGHVTDREELAGIFSNSDVFLMPSESEGLPNALLEALACGVPAVASDIPGIRAASGPGVTLVSGDDREWCERILDAVARGPSRDSLLGDRAGSFDEVAQRHRAVFEWAIDRRKERHPHRRRRLKYTTTGAT